MEILKNSVAKRQEYKKMCKSLGKDAYSPLLDVETRWNSTYAMLFRACQMSDVSAMLVFRGTILLKSGYSSFEYYAPGP